jgi:ribosomal protein L11 methyltransferase
MPKSGILDVIILPKMSFGTGHHATTYLMSEALFDMDVNSKSILDMGSGTGVLAIIAAKRGAIAIDAIDIDDWCVENSIENCSLNSCEKIQVQKGDVALISKHYDIIAANINKNVLKKDMSTYIQHLNANGYLLISGFFVTDAEELSDLAIALGLKWVATFNKDNWAMIKFVK